MFTLVSTRRGAVPAVVNVVRRVAGPGRVSTGTSPPRSVARLSTVPATPLLLRVEHSRGIHVVHDEEIVPWVH